MARKNIQDKVDFEVKKDALHRELHIKPGTHIPVATLQHEKAIAKRTHNTQLMRRTQFALNFGHKG